ncbi:MAG: hypothetical protein HYV77_00225 [Candidatus Wildermuthbacteria bacterium]|nr:hypothetical protein [Candidatus Wildermuthbacteria bacterium]
MKINPALIFLLSVIAVILVVGVFVLYFYVVPRLIATDDLNVEGITSFEACLKKGYPIMESYPRQCKAPYGRTFTEDIRNEPEKRNLIRIANPRPGDAIESPLVITGEAREGWYSLAYSSAL